jgi:3-hydroxypropanoate dehydrogenase
MVINDVRMNLILRKARTHSAWLDKPVDDALLRQVYDLAKLGLAAAYVNPLRVVFVKSGAAKERLKTTLPPEIETETVAAPVTAILGLDTRAAGPVPDPFPPADARAWFEELPDHAREPLALRSTALQCVYLMLAARALGLDCGPMAGFDRAKVDAEFFAGTTVKSDFLCNLGYGDTALLYPRAPRPDFDQACRIV